ncbi:MAG: nitroreductase family protein [Anaerocolumna sp.]
MNLYEAIFARKSIKKYSMDKLDDSMFINILGFAHSLSPISKDLNVEYKIIDYDQVQQSGKNFGHIKAPYYLLFYSNKGKDFEINAGFLMEQITLYLTTKGLGSCYCINLNLKKNMSEDSGLEFMIGLAFGKSEGEVYREVSKVKRLPLSDIAYLKEDISKNTKAILNAVRLSPSNMNSQPWRLVVYDNRIHIFCKKNIFLKSVLKDRKMIDIGISLAHLFIAAEEMWVNATTVHLDNISQQQFKKNDYVITVKMS